jgi:hypothetical protein
MKLALASCLIAGAFAACGGRHLPPGTPPPEYEPPVVTPWPTPAQGADAGSDANPPNAGERADAGTPPAGESDLSLDAGPT